MTAVCFPLFFGSTGLYVYVVTMACSQLEKLKATIMNINQNQNVDSEVVQDKEVTQVGVRASQKIFHHLQTQLNECIRHHQQILEYDTPHILPLSKSRPIFHVISSSMILVSIYRVARDFTP
jgi:hypothetical protein